LAKAVSSKIYLETNGTLPEALMEVIEYIDFISMDWKLDIRLWKLHEAFLQIAIAKQKNIYLKIVYQLEEKQLLKKALKQIHRISPEVLVFLQPAEPQTDYQKLLDCFFQMIQYHPNIRFLPQIHKWLGVR